MTADDIPGAHTPPGYWKTMPPPILEGWKPRSSVAPMGRSEGAFEGKDHPDRADRFRYINGQAKKYPPKKWPVISVDTKKKELVGECKNAGKEWRKKGNPRRVNTHDFPARGLDKAVPYGGYAIGKDMGWVHVGCDSDTAIIVKIQPRMFVGRFTGEISVRIRLRGEGGPIWKMNDTFSL